MDDQEQAANQAPDDNDNPADGIPTEAAAPDTGAIEAAGPASDGDGGRSRPDVSHMVAQLQQMIDQVATAATPAMREVAAKAAELAAKAGEAAGPMAQKAAHVTAQVGERVAARSTRLASDLRSQRNPPADGQEPDQKQE